MSGSFKDKDWNQRYESMGDEAEAVFEAAYPQGFVRFGLDRPPLRMMDLPTKIRYTPDYLTGKGLVEVQGLGRDRKMKVKLEKLASLQEWAKDFRVDLFLWDRTAERFGFVRLPDLATALYNGGNVGHFPEGKAYLWLHVDDVPVCTWYSRLERMDATEARDG